ncbi:uncharacterized protein LOC141672569 [Apium graveolens]|uniref:uncharacterized protein LOC141672569 n=1 Tax=Apium graveolens TaxID=4045 RepID=UPI003D7B971E
MAPKQSTTCFSSSGRVEYAITNHVAFLDKESVHQEFHPLMDFLNNSPVSYALTASSTIYAEVVEEMWTSACCSVGQIKLKIQGKSYILTPSVINEALHLPNSNFENLPSDDEISIMLYSIKYASKTTQLGQINRKYLRKEWSYFFDTLTKVFTGKCGGYDAIIRFVQKIAYSLMYNRTIDIGSLLLYEFSYKLGDTEKRSKVIYYARFLMIIANHLCKNLSIKDKDDTLQVFVQSKVLFSNLVKNNFHDKVKFVLPKHIRAQLSTLSSSPPHTTASPNSTAIDVKKEPISHSQVKLPSLSESETKTSSSVCGKRKKTTLPTITVDGNEESETAMEVNPPQKKINASVVKPELRLSSEHPEMPPGFLRTGIPVAGLPSSLGKEKLPSQSQSESKTTSSVCGQRKKTTLPTITVHGNEEITAMEVNPHQKNINPSIVKPELRLSSEDPEIPPGFLRNGVSVAGLPSSLEQEKAKCDLRYVLEPTLDPFSDENMLPEDRQHLVNAASVLKSQLVARLKINANLLSSDDKITLANRCYYALRELGDDYASFRSKVDKLIKQHKELESVARKKENWNDQVICDYYFQQLKSVSDLTKKLAGVENELSEAKTSVSSMKFKEEELTVALLKLKEELYEEEERVKVLTAEYDRCKEAQSDAKAELSKLDIKKEEARVEFKAINDQYNIAKEKCERLYKKLLQLAKK